ncbi:MAG TPA: OmpA family protein [Candidatus Acidoferrales bacterium]|nr:OmpA family protein [Candidatus Acidoferrales bacterium]
MSFQSKSHPGRVLAMVPAMIAVLCTFATLAAAQDQPAPKWELYGGYSLFHPGADVHGQLPGALLPLSSRLEANPRGAGASLTYDFNRWFGLTLDTSIHWGSGEAGLAKRIDDAAFSNLSFGPKVTFRHEHISPFLEVLVGDHRLMPDAFHDVDKLGLMLGGGLDINLSRHVALRLIRADYVVSNYRYGPPGIPSTDIRGLRLQAGLNFMFGGEKPPTPPSAACSVQPAEVFAGEPVSATTSGSNFNPRRTVKYDWHGTGVKVAGSEASTQIDTTGLQPGSYEVTANLNDGSRKNGFASCSARFTVKEPHPPVISCSAAPASVRMSGSSTINSRASSPDGRRLTYSYTASAGEISSNGDTATLNTRSAQPGHITVTCNVNDDRNPPLTASSTTMVNVEAPPPPPAPAPEIKQLETRLALHSIYFPTARPSPENPTGGLVDSQAEILKILASDFKSYLRYKPDAHLILGGHADPRGSEEYNKALTQRRVERTKNFLVEHGVPADHFETRSFGKEDQLSADQVKEQIAQNTELTPADRHQMLNNLSVLVLANNRRVDVTLSTTGQQSTRGYPFNAKDYLALINPKGGEKKPPVKKKPRR